MRPTLSSLLVNVNVCYTAFYKEQNLAFAMEEFARGSFGGLVDKYVEGVRVSPTHVSLSFACRSHMLTSRYPIASLPTKKDRKKGV